MTALELHASDDFGGAGFAPRREPQGVSLRGVTKAFGDRVVIAGLDLEIIPGEFLALVGPSGCGKSTMLRLVAGIEDATEGEIWIGDRLVNDVAAKNRDVAMVFQTYALYPHLTVYRNLAMPLELRKFPRRLVEARVEAAAELLDIAYLLNRKPGLLSGGQRQRVALARAMVRDPALFLLDEPLSNLDAKHRLALRAEIAKLHRTLGSTFIHVTHDQAEAMAMADRIAVMREGRIEQVAPPQELYDSPANMFVAGFFGSPQMNMLRTSPGVVVGIRPEHLSLKPPEHVSPENVVSFDVVVQAVEPMGASTRLTASLGPTTLVANLAARCAAQPGERLTLHADMTAAHLFDPVTGRALPRTALRREMLQ